MTREEQIKQEAKDNLVNELIDSKVDFIRGAKWADNNPNWHNVADGDLPKDGTYGVCIRHGKLRSYKYVNNQFVGALDIMKGVTHWAEIKLPQE